FLSWDSFASWLYRIASSLCKRWLRAQSRRCDREFIEDKDVGMLEDYSMDSYREELAFKSLHEALDSLPEDHRQVLTLHYLGGMTSYEIARFVGMAPATIRRRLIKARASLKAEMLTTMDAVFEEQKLPASFTLRIAELVKHIRIKPLPRLAELPWGVSAGAVILSIILSLGIFDGIQEVMNRNMAASSEPTGSAGRGEILVDIVDQKIYEREGDTSMLNNRKISAVGVASVLTAVLTVLSSNAMVETEWEKSLGGAKMDNGTFVQQTTDGGYIISGATESFSSDGSYDMWLVKTDKDGNYDLNFGDGNGWMAFGGGNYESGRWCQQTEPDGGYIIVGVLDNSSKGRGNDVYLVKTDATGKELWRSAIGGDQNDDGMSGQQTEDGGYIVAGYSYSFGFGGADVHLVKTDANGDEVWQKAFGGAAKDEGYGVQQTEDGGYIIIGRTFSFGAGSGDIYLIKTDENGNYDLDFGNGKGWMTFGGSSEDMGYSVRQIADDGYILAGWTASFGTGSKDVWLIKTDRDGNEEWNRTFGGSGSDPGLRLQLTADGGYIICGYTEPAGGGVNSRDVYLVKTDALGNMEWEYIVENEGQDEGFCVQQTADLGYIVSGQTDDSPGSYYSDAYLVKIEPENQPPTVGPISVDSPVVAVHTVVNANADFTDPNKLDTHTAEWDWDVTTSSGTVDESNGSGTANGSYSYDTPGVYTINLEVTDDNAAIGNAEPYEFVVAYDPSSGFVTGGGWIDSPGGAYTVDPTLIGKANFGFVSKYKKGADVPTGNTQFVFRMADLNFHSTEYDWLVVAGDKAKFKGLGTVNGENSYQFMLTATDGDDGVDKFRIKIWDADGVLYDNKHGSTDDSDDAQEIGGGSIVIHKDKQNAAPSRASAETSLLAAYPNPANPDVWIPYRLSDASAVTIRIHDSAGRLVRTLDLGTKPAGFYTDKMKAAHWDGANESGESVASGLYFYTIQAGDEFAATRKMLILK
ncbi:sigma-70 family RNA polymerase sigma factor, partial [Candidatus Poribacteria bacterium]